jgi:hypothetical protein
LVIEIITFITRYSADYAEFLKVTCERYQSGKHTLRWRCVESVGAERLPEGYEFICKTHEAYHSSMNHAIALNATDEYIESDYVIYIDADMAILYPCWDDVIVKELNENDCFGGSYGHGNKYQNFPTVYLFAFRSYILDHVCLNFEPKLVPGKESVYRHTIQTEEEAECFGLNIGQTIKCDTGWYLPAIIKRAGYKASSMPMVLMTSSKSLLPFESGEQKQFCLQKPTHMCEWHYNGKLFATHKQASRNHPINEGWGAIWKRRVELYMEHLDVKRIR